MLITASALVTERKLNSETVDWKSDRESGETASDGAEVRHAFDASGAAMVAVNMTDGGGGRKSDTSPSSFFRKANQTIKTAVTRAVNSAAEAAKAAQQSALTQAQISSILKESRNPANVWEKARANRAQAQASTTTVRDNSFFRRTMRTACMSQEEYDDYWIINGLQSSQSITSEPMSFSVGSISNLYGTPNSDVPMYDRQGNYKGYRHFGDDGRAECDYSTTNHGNPKTHPLDEKGGHYDSWDWSDPSNPRHSNHSVEKPEKRLTIPDKDGNDDGDGNKDGFSKKGESKDEKRSRNENRQPTTADRIIAGATMVGIGIALIVIIADDATVIGIGDDYLIPELVLVGEQQLSIVLG